MHLWTLAGPTGYLNLTQWSWYSNSCSCPDYTLALALAQLASYLGIRVNPMTEWLGAT